MSIYKNQHRDHRTWKQIISGWFGRQCPSEIKAPSWDYTAFCTLRNGHNGPHYSSAVHKYWGYGDNWIEMAQGEIW